MAKTVAKVLDECNLWNSIKMSVADKTSVNTRKKNGVVAQLHRIFLEKDINKLQFINCQHHILEKILCVVMDEELTDSTKSPNIKYRFVPELLKKYEKLKAEFVNGTEHFVPSTTSVQIL